MQVIRPDGAEVSLPQTDGAMAAALVCVAFRAGAEVRDSASLMPTLSLPLIWLAVCCSHMWQCIHVSLPVGLSLKPRPRMSPLSTCPLHEVMLRHMLSSPSWLSEPVPRHTSHEVKVCAVYTAERHDRGKARQPVTRLWPHMHCHETS